MCFLVPSQRKVPSNVLASYMKGTKFCCPASAITSTQLECPRLPPAFPLPWCDPLPSVHA